MGGWGGEGEKQGTTTLGFSTLLKDSPNAVSGGGAEEEVGHFLP